MNCGRHPDTASPWGPSPLSPRPLPSFRLTFATRFLVIAMASPATCTHFTSIPDPQSILFSDPGFASLLLLLVNQCRLPQLEIVYTWSPLPDTSEIIKKMVEPGTTIDILGRWLLVDYREDHSDCLSSPTMESPPREAVSTPHHACAEWWLGDFCRKDNEDTWALVGKMT